MSSAGTQTVNALGPRPQSTTATWTAAAANNYHDSLPSTTDANTRSLTTTMSADTAFSWFDTAGIDAMMQPLDMSIDTNNMPFLGPTVGLHGYDGETAMTDLAAVDALHPTSSSEGSAKFVLEKSKLHGPSDWFALLKKVNELRDPGRLDSWLIS